MPNPRVQTPAYANSIAWLAHRPAAESLLHILDSYGPDQLAAALVGDSGER